MGTQIQPSDINSIGLSGDSMLGSLSCDIAQSLLHLWAASTGNDGMYSGANLMPTPNGSSLYVNRNSFA